jgi:hypothetical protein
MDAQSVVDASLEAFARTVAGSVYDTIARVCSTDRRPHSFGPDRGKWIDENWRYYADEAVAARKRLGVSLDVPYRGV